MEVLRKHLRAVFKWEQYHGHKKVMAQSCFRCSPKFHRLCFFSRRFIVPLSNLDFCCRRLSVFSQGFVYESWKLNIGFWGEKIQVVYNLFSSLCRFLTLAWKHTFKRQSPRTWAQTQRSLSKVRQLRVTERWNPRGLQPLLLCDSLLKSHLFLQTEHMTFQHCAGRKDRLCP